MRELGLDRIGPILLVPAEEFTFLFAISPDLASKDSLRILTSKEGDSSIEWEFDLLLLLVLVFVVEEDAIAALGTGIGSDPITKSSELSLLSSRSLRSMASSSSSIDSGNLFGVPPLLWLGRLVVGVRGVRGGATADRAWRCNAASEAISAWSRPRDSTASWPATRRWARVFG